MTLSVEARLLALSLVEALQDGRSEDADAIYDSSHPREIYMGLIQMTSGLLAQVGADNGIPVRDVIANYRAGLLQVAE